MATEKGKEKQLCGFSHLKQGCIKETKKKRDVIIFVHLAMFICGPSSVSNVQHLRLLAFIPQTQRLQHESEETSELAQNCLARLPAAFQPWKLSHTAEAGQPWWAAEPEVPLLAVRLNRVFSAYC